MAHSLWRCGRHRTGAVFELFFRDNPFGGGFTIFAGLQNCLSFIHSFSLSSTAYVNASPSLSLSLQVALMEVSGPLAVVQLLETPLLNLVNYASLVATNAARFRLLVGPRIKLFELGLRRAQGPDGGLSGSKYSYIGGFDYTSNLLAGKLYGIPVRGSMAHSYITSFTSISELTFQTLKPVGDGAAVDFVGLSERWLGRVCRLLEESEEFPDAGERAAFISFALCYPSNFVALVDTYSVRRSGLPNFCAVALTLDELGYRAIGVRLDSGDLRQQSLHCRSVFRACSQTFEVPWFANLSIMASNNISEENLKELQCQEHEIDYIGVGTNLVTCPLQPSLGCVYKLTEVNGKARIKLSEDQSKTTLPGRKNSYRLYSPDGHPLLDLLTLHSEEAPRAGEEVQCCALGRKMERLQVTAANVEPLLSVYFERGQVRASSAKLGAGVRGWGAGGK
uniref:Nicotinate phosphoribosyltransferase n=1 Tax=Callorhinchus milii TaxID=7868 RepID=A0A4W3GKX9_CALMI